MKISGCHVFVLIALLVATRSSDAHAACTVSSPAPLAVVAARHSARPIDGGLRWDTQFVLDIDAVFDFCGGTIELAVPLPEGERLLPSPDVEALVRDGRIVGLRVGPTALSERSIRASLVQPTGAALDHDVQLGAPVASSDAVQIVDSAVGIELARSEALEERFHKHLGFVAPRAVSAGAREEARRLTDATERVSRPSIYVRGSDLRAAGELRGRLRSSAARSKSTAAFVGLVFLGVVGLLVLAARKLRHATALERAEATLASEIDALGEDR